MDATRFDFLTRAVGQRLSRRHLVAAAAALLAGSATPRPTGAVVRHTCRPYGTGCSRNEQCCSGACNTRRTDPRAIRNRCVCAAGEIRCDGACTDIVASTDNCGSCGNVCDPDVANACVSGVCSCGQWTACAKGVDCAFDHCNACADSTALICLVLANGQTREGNFAESHNPDGDPCRSDADCALSTLTCNAGMTMHCVAAWYWGDTLSASYPAGWCHCIDT